MLLSIHNFNYVNYSLCCCNLQAGWTRLNSSLRGNLRKLSKSLVFVSARNPESKLTFDTVMSEAKHATIGMYMYMFS